MLQLRLAAECWKDQLPEDLPGLHMREFSSRMFERIYGAFEKVSHKSLENAFVGSPSYWILFRVC